MNLVKVLFNILMGMFCISSKRLLLSSPVEYQVSQFIIIGLFLYPVSALDGLCIYNVFGKVDDESCYRTHRVPLPEIHYKTLCNRVFVTLALLACVHIFSTLSSHCARCRLCVCVPLPLSITIVGLHLIWNMFSTTSCMVPRLLNINSIFCICALFSFHMICVCYHVSQCVPRHTTQMTMWTMKMNHA